jgi:hypothetical protein
MIAAMKRRDFITLIGGTVAVWPLAVNAQQPERPRRIGVLMNRAADNPEGQNRLAALHQGLQRPRRRGDRVRGYFAAIAHSRFWHEV